MKTSATSLGLVLATLGAASSVAGSDFDMTGTYEGVCACDNVTAGVPSTWSRPVKVNVVHRGATLHADLRYTDRNELGREFTAYRGEVSESPGQSFVTGYLESCGGTFPELELVRLFPASVSSVPFRFAADGIWASSDIPNVPGLTVQSCKWSMKRVSSSKPTLKPCSKDKTRDTPRKSRRE